MVQVPCHELYDNWNDSNFNKLALEIFSVY